MTKTSYLTLVLSLLIFLQSCGEGSDESSKVLIKQIPESPIVIIADLKIEEKSVSGPWFSVKFRGKNKTNKTLTVVSFLMEIESRVDDEVTTVNWSPPNEGPVLHIVPSGELFGGITTYLVGGLPKNPSFRYTAKVTFQGWFNKNDNPDTPFDESTEPESRFKTSIRFRTQ